MNLKDVLTPEEFASVTEKSDWLGARIIAFDWVVIAGTFYLAGTYPNPVTLLLAILILGARQLGLGVIVHETGHRTLFSSRALNDFCGTWLTGYLVFSNKDAYMRGHLKHHRDAGTDQDPDLSNYRDYPIGRERLQRKIVRDLTGQVGWRRIKSLARAIAKLPSLDEENRSYLIGSIAMNVLIFGALAVWGHAWVYLLWVAAFMTSHMLVSRIRQIAEHAAVPDLYDPDPRRHTRTLYINWLERLLIAPHGVNYHLEHHLLASVPIYRLRLLHEILLRKGFYEGVEFEKGYLNLLRNVTYATADSSAGA
ncbi:MAG TPA: fatty acid desaturase family protein [Pseudomonadales bacterium]|nr:fatty acid desaturase family protein [Pseudomonadales bacterium]